MASSPVLKKTLDKSSNDKLFMGDRSIVLGLLMVKRYISFWGLWRLPLPFRSGRDDAPADCFFRQSCTLKIVGTPAKNNLLFSTNQNFNLSVSRILRPEGWPSLSPWRQLISTSPNHTLFHFHIPLHIKMSTSYQSRVTSHLTLN